MRIIITQAMEKKMDLRRPLSMSQITSGTYCVPKLS